MQIKYKKVMTGMYLVYVNGTEVGLVSKFTDFWKGSIAGEDSHIARHTRKEATEELVEVAIQKQIIRGGR